MGIVATMISITLEQQGRQQLDQLCQRLANPTPLMHAIGAELDGMAQTAFNAKRSPDGVDWDDLSPVTAHLRALRANGGQKMTPKKRKVAAKYERAYANASSAGGILNDTSSLIRTFRWQASGASVQLQAGPHPSGVAIHLFGGMAGRGRKVEIIARPWWPVAKAAGGAAFTPAGERAIVQVMRRYIEGGV